MLTPDHASDIRLFNSAFELLKEWMDIEEADDFQPLGNAAVYKTSVVLWLMLFNASTQTLALKKLLSTSLPMLQGARTPTNDFEMELSLNGLARIATQEKDLR